MLVERRAAEPILPLSLFRNRTFAVTSAVGFIVGFALFGAITFLPLYLQVTKGSSPTRSGLELTPLMGGLLVTSIVSGNLITRWGRYRPFPIAGTAIMAVGLFLLSRLEVDTPTWEALGARVVLGLGLGMVMQVLVLAVQNAVDPRQLGVATSGSTLFRQIGGSIGVVDLRRDLRQPAAFRARLPLPAGATRRRARATRARSARSRRKSAPSSSRRSRPRCIPSSWWRRPSRSSRSRSPG